MEIFELILLMLSAVFLSNVLSRFLPSIAVPLIQVVFGDYFSDSTWRSYDGFESGIVFVTIYGADSI